MKNNNKNKNLFNAISTVFAWFSFILAIILAGLTIFASFSDEQNGKSVFGYKMLIVNSDSMSLAQNAVDEKVYFNAGDVIVIKTIEANHVFKEGDVITFISQNGDSLGKTLTHKVREVKEDSKGNLIGYVTYGIYTGKNDESLVTPTNIIGVYSCKIPSLGTFFTFLKTPGGYFTSILIPCVFLIIFFSIKVGKHVALREVGSVYDVELENLKQRVSILENALDKSITISESALTVDAQNDVEIEPSESFVNESESEILGLNIKSKKISFSKKLLSLNSEIKEYYNKIYNEFISYLNVKDRLSFKGISFKIGRKLLAKITVRGKTLTLYLALNVSDFNKNVYFQKDASSVKAYSEVPFLVKVKSDRGLKNALTLISALMQNNGIVKKENYEAVNAILLLSSNLEEVAIDNFVIPNKQGFNINAKRISFLEKLLSLNEQVKEYYNKIYNEFLSYKKLNARLSFKGTSFRFGRKLFAKIIVRGKTLTLYLALNVNEFNKSVYFQKDASSVKAYSEVPFVVKVKSDRGLKNALTLISTLMLINGVLKKENYEAVNAILLLSSNLEEVAIDNLALPNKYGFLKNVKKLSFTKKISRLNKEVKGYYQAIRLEFNSHKNVKERLSFKGLSFNKGRKLLAKITVRGKTLTLYLALNVNEFNKNVYFQKDASSVKAYSNVPFLFKVKSKRALKNALNLIAELMKQNGIEKVGF